MARPSERLAELGLTLPDVPTPVAAYVPAVRSGSLVYSSGQLPTRSGALLAVGKVGAEVSLETATDCSRLAALNGIAAVASVAGGVDAIERVVKATVFVACASDFTAQAQVANGASGLLGDVFGESGHARSAVGVAVLPLDAPVEVEFVVQVRSQPTIHPA